MIEKRHLTRWVKIGSSTTYKKVVQFEKKGYVTSEVTKSATPPDKTVYTITSDGKKAFAEMMEEFSKAPTRIILDFNAVLVNLAVVNDDTASAYLAAIRQSIGNTKEQIAQQLDTPNGRTFLGDAILEQQAVLLEALAQWEQSFEKDFFAQQAKKEEGQ